MVLITKNFSRMLKRANKQPFKKFNNRRQSSGNSSQERSSNNDQKDTQQSSSRRGIQCRECDGFGHIQAECANTLKRNKKNYNASLSEDDSDDSSSESDDETIAFTAQTTDFQDPFALAEEEESDNEEFPWMKERVFSKFDEVMEP